MSYASLHCHDEYSNVTTGLDSINKLENMVAYCRELGLKGMALTNHDNLSSIWKVNQLQKKLREEGSDFKLIFGNEIYLLKDWDPTDTKPRKYPHFILIAKDKIGFDALLKLSSKAWYRSQVLRGKRRVVTLYEDIEKIITPEVRGHIVASSACFPKGTLVSTLEGEKPIEEIVSGDLVLSEGGWQPVVVPTSRDYSGNMYSLISTHGGSLGEIVATEDHKFATIKKNNSKRLYPWPAKGKEKLQDFEEFYRQLPKGKRGKYTKIADVPEIEWKEIKNLDPTEDVLLIPIDRREPLKENEITWSYTKRVNAIKVGEQGKKTTQLTPEFCELFGIWLAEGSWDYNHRYPGGNLTNRISFCIHKKEEELKNRIIYLMETIFPDKSPTFHLRKSSQAQHIYYNSVEIATFWGHLYEGFLSSEVNQWTKFVPEVLQRLPDEYQLQIYKGWLMGDGYFRAKIAGTRQGNEYVGATVSRQLALDLVRICQRNYINPTVQISKAHTGSDGTFHKQAYYLTLAGDVAEKVYTSILTEDKLNFTFLERLGKDLPIFINGRDYLTANIKRITNLGHKNEKVYCLNVENYHSFTVGNILVHNCLGGALPQSYLNNRPEEGQEFLDWCVKVFGYDDFYIELQSSAIPDQTKWNNIIAEQLFDNYQTIITTDVHYTKKEDFDALEAFLRSTNESREVKEFYDAAYIQSESEISEYLHYLPKEIIDKSLENTRKIADQVEFFDLSQKFHIPKVNVEWLEWDGPTLEEYPVISELLKSRDIQTNYCLVTCLKKLREINKFTPEYLERLEHEFDVFKWQSEELNDNFFAYFNNMQYYLNLSWEVGCAVGPSRGSASGSLLCYLMGIVQCDPIEKGLYFWRFANKHRASVLDCDCDFDPVHRPRLIEAIRRERGELGITAVATFKTLTLRAAIGNACRGYKSKEFPNGIDSDIAAYLSSLVEVQRGFVANLKQSLEGDEVRGFKKNTQLINEIRKYPGLFEMIQIFEGLITNSSTHAAAVIFFDLENDPITNHCSLMRSPNGDLCTALDLRSVEEVGCIKYDYLALSTLSIMTATFQLLQKDGVIPKELTLKECYRTYIDPNKIDYENPEIWKHLKENDVLSIFQWDQPSGKKGIATTQPHTLDELTVANGLIRLMNEEGQESQLDRFVRIKNKPQSFEDEMREAGLTKEQRQLMHEELDRYHGCCAMQESFMLLSQKIAGYSQAEADKLRKVVANSFWRTPLSWVKQRAISEKAKCLIC